MTTPAVTGPRTTPAPTPITPIAPPTPTARTATPTRTATPAPAPQPSRTPRPTPATPGPERPPMVGQGPLQGLDLAAANALVVERGSAGLSAIGAQPEVRLPLGAPGLALVGSGQFGPGFRDPQARIGLQARTETPAGRLTLETGARFGHGVRALQGSATLTGEGGEARARIEADRRGRIQNGSVGASRRLAPGLTLDGRIDFGQAGRVQAAVLGASYQLQDVRFSTEVRQDLRTGATSLQAAAERQLAPGWTLGARGEHDLRTGRTAVGVRLTGRF